MLGKGTLAERQEAMRQRMARRAAEREQALRNRELCISCKHRQAKIGSAFCSRCSGIKLQNQLRDTLPGLSEPVGTVKAEIPTPTQGLPLEEDNNILEVEEEKVATPKESKEEIQQAIADKEIFTRKEVADMLGISRGTISKWEKKGKVPAPRRTVHNNQCLYTRENIEAIKEYKDREYIPQFNLTPKDSAAAIPKVMKSTFKQNRRAERAILGRIGKLGILGR